MTPWSRNVDQSRSWVRSPCDFCGFRSCISAHARVAALDGDWFGHVHAQQGAEGGWL